MLLQFQSMWDSHFVCIAVTWHHIKLLKPDTAPVQSIVYQASPKPSEFEKAKIGKMLPPNITIAQTEWVAQKVFVLKKDGALQFLVHFPKIHAATKQESYPIPLMDGCND